MKKVGEYTLRGTLEGESTTPIWDKILLFDGKFTTGYRIVEFVVSAVNSSSAQDVTGKLATEPTAVTTIGLGNYWNWADNREIAWASANNVTSSIREGSFSLTDPDNLVIEDLYVSVQNNAGSTEQVNYFIKMEKYEFSDSIGALAMVRNRSQT